MIGACALEQSGGALSNDQIGDIIRSVAGKLQQARVANPGSSVRGTASDYSLIASYTKQEVAARQDGTRPFNVSGAHPTQLAAAGGEPGGLGHAGQYAGLQGFQRLAALREREREAARESGSSSSGSDNRSSSARYDGMVSDWGSPRGLALSRSYAASNDMGWAMKDPDLMRMGKPALQALKDSGLKGDGYQALRSPKSLGFDNPTIVKGADYMKRNKLNYDDAAKAAAAVHNHKSMSPEEKGQWKGAVGGALRADPGEAEQKAKQHLHDTGSSLKEKHPEMKPEVDKALEKFKADMGAGLKAKMERKAAEAKPADPSPSSQPSPPSQQAAQKRTDNLRANLLNMYK